MKPTIGRIVHYTRGNDDYGVCTDYTVYAAIITDVSHLDATAADEEIGYEVSLTVFIPSGIGIMSPVNGIRFTDAEPGSQAACGKWAWPPTVY